MTELTGLLRTIREVRDYGEGQVPPGALMDILEVARWTGSSKNSQRWELVIVENRETLRQIAAAVPAADHIARAALAIVQVTTSHENVDDLGRQAERIMLAAHAYGIGSSLVPIESAGVQRRIRELLGIPPRRVVPTVVALGHPGQTQDRSGPAEGESKEAIRFLRGLRSVRRYAERPIPAEVQREICAAAELTTPAAPGPFTVMAVDDQDTLVQLAALAPNGGHLASAPLAVVRVVMAPEEAPRLGKTSRVLLAGRVTEQLMLAAWARGVGSCVIAVFPAENQRRARALLGTPPDRWISVIALGYPADERARFFSADPSVLLRPVPTGRKPLSQLVSWERYGQRQASG